MVDYRGGIAIGEIIIYLPALAIAILLVIRHGFGRNSGWIFLILFTLLRIVGACFQLALENDLKNQTLQTGTAILTTIGLSPLLLCALGLLSRVISSINRSFPTFISPRLMKIGQLIVTIGFILAIIGGVNSSTQYVKDLQALPPGQPSSSVQPVPQQLSKVAVGLFIVGYLIILASALVISFSISHAEPGEKRLLLAVALSLPFIFVRLLYSTISAFGDSVSFRTDTTILLCMAFLMELASVIIFESIGLTLRKSSLTVTPGDTESHEDSIDGSQPSRWAKLAHNLPRRTIIGRLIARVAGGGEEYEMQGPRGGRRARRQDRPEAYESGYRNVSNI